MDLNNNDNPNNSTPTRRHRNQIQVAICAASEAQHEDLCASLARLTEVNLELIDIAATPRSAATRTEGFVILIVVLRADSEMWPLQIHEWTERVPQAAVIAAVDQHSGDAVRQALRAGAQEVIFLPSDPTDLARCLVKISEAHHDNAANAVVCSLVSVAGGAGVTSVTAALAFALMRQQHKRVAL